MDSHGPAGETHLDEGELIRHLDGELTAEERPKVAAHLLSCRACAESLQSIRDERTQLDELLRDLTVPAISMERRQRSLDAVRSAARRRPVRVGFWSRPAIRAAAVAGLVATSALTASPVRAWLAEMWRSAGANIGVLAPVAVREAAPISLANATVGFVPAGDVFSIEIESFQAQGNLILGVAGGEAVNARSVGETPVDLVVLPTGMRIQNVAGSSADYTVSLPLTLSEVRVRIGDAPVTVYRMEELRAAWVSVIRLTEP
jgi:hypothetical protein